VIARLLFALLVLLPVPAAAQATLPAQAILPTQPITVAGSFLEGSWALRLDGAIVMRFDLKRKADGWEGAWVKPTSFRSDSGGRRFGEIVMPAVERHADSSRTIGDWAELTFNDPRPGQEPDVFRLHLLSADRAELIYVGTGMAPYTLERVGAGALLGPFEAGGVYDNQPDNPRIAERPVTAVGPPLAGQPVQRPARISPSPQTTPAQGPPDTRRPAMTGR
jgi:hypothetical protein